MNLKDLKKCKWTVQRAQTGRSIGIKLDGLTKCKWTVQRDETRRSKGMKLDGLKKVTCKLGLWDKGNLLVGVRVTSN